MASVALVEESGVNILQVFNQYLQYGGEEKSVERIRERLAERHSLRSFSFQSADWVGKDAPGIFSQAGRVFYNPKSARELRAQIDKFKPHAILLHNLFPVGSPSVYRTALKANIPVIQYIHNFRPFSVSGTLWANGQICEESLRGNYWREVRYGAWQHSVLKSAVFAAALKFLHFSGWLEAVKGWIAISSFMRDKFVEAGIPRSRIHVLSHFWDMQTESNAQFEDHGHYLYLGRLVEEKGIHVLLAAWQLIVSAMGPAAPHLWVGGSGPLSDTVRMAASSNPKIRFLGFVDGDEKIRAISTCRAMIAPSTWWEPLGLVTYEAYDYKKPMFAAASGGLTETIEHGLTGFLHEAGKSSELAQQVIAFEGVSSADRLAMGRAGRRWLECNAGADAWQGSFDRTLQLILDA